MRKLLVATLLSLMLSTANAGPPQPLGYLGILLIYTKDNVKQPMILGFTKDKQDCLEKGRKFVEEELQAANDAGVVLSVACMPVPPPPSEPPAPKPPLNPSTDL